MSQGGALFISQYRTFNPQRVFTWQFFFLNTRARNFEEKKKLPSMAGRQGKN